jgi:O-antigen/teichoic acid export membrane protein
MVAEHKAPTLRRNLSWTVVGNVFYAATQWAMLIMLAKLGTPQMVGMFALGLAIAAPVLMFTNLQLRAVQATDAEFRYRFGDYLALRLIGTTLALVVVLGIVYFAGYQRETALVILAVGLAKAFESVSDVFYGLFLQHERMDRMAKSMIAKGSFSLVAFGLGVYLTGNLVWGVLGLGLVWALVLVCYDLRNGAWVLKNWPSAPNAPTPKEAGGAAKLRPYWSVKTLTRLAWLALPLGFVTGLLTFNANVPRYFVEHYLGGRELGIFAAMAYATVAGTTVVNAMGQSASPRLAKYYAARNREGFCVLLLKLAGVGASLGVAGVLLTVVAGREILTLIYGPEYAGQEGVFTWLMVAAGIFYVASFLGYAVTAARYFAVQVPLFVLAGCVTALACLWLVPAAGLQGAALAVVLTAAVQGFATLAIVAHAIRGLRKRPQFGVPT